MRCWARLSPYQTGTGQCQTDAVVLSVCDFEPTFVVVVFIFIANVGAAVVVFLVVVVVAFILVMVVALC